ncbi:hypothetical protein Tco_1504008 [Tanacetum coccineum]
MNNSVTIAYRFEITLQLCLFDGSKLKNNDELQPRLSNFFKNFDSHGGDDLCYQGGLDQRLRFLVDGFRLFIRSFLTSLFNSVSDFSNHHDRIDESTNHENFGFDILQIGCNDVHTSECLRSGGF